MDNHKHFDELQLLSNEDFSSILPMETVSDKDYNHAQNVWESFGCQNLGDCHDLYFRTDALLLADVFETFRDASMNHYDLDPANYFSAPGMSRYAPLKLTKVKLYLPTDIDQHLFIFLPTSTSTYL